MRIELKYRPPTYSQNILFLLDAQLQPLGFFRRQYTVQNLYFDTAQKASYFQKKHGDYFKVKYRLRGYNEAVNRHFEVKSKHGFVGFKIKKTVSDQNQFIDFLFARSGLLPVCEVKYNRIAWENSKHMVKVNFDSQIRFRGCHSGRQGFEADPVLELKFLCGDSGGQMFDQLLKNLGCTKTSVSKFVLGVEDVT